MTTLEEARDYVIGRGVRLDVARRAGLRVGNGVQAGRVIIPWFDERGEEVYATGRSLNGQAPKYRHTQGPRPPLYASPGAWGSERVALVEGHIDALVSASGGMSAFATAGSSLVDAAVEILSTRQEVVIVPDNDEAGARWLDEATDKLSGRVPRLLVARVPEGWKDIADVGEAAAARGDDPGEAVAEVLYGAAPVEPDGPQQAVAEPERKAVPLDLNILREPLEPPCYVLDPYLIHGEVVNLTAIWGAGKTWLALDLATAVADETIETWLDMPVRHGSVVYVDEESSFDIVHERLTLLGADPDRLEGRLHLYLNQGFRLDDETWIAELHRIAARVEPILFVFDSFPRFHGLDENSSGDMAALYDLAFKPLSRTFGASVVLLDHPPKDSLGRTRDPAQATRGSGDKVAAVDRGWLLRKRAEDAVSLEHMKVRRGTWPPSILVRRVLSEGRLRHVNEGEHGIETTRLQADLLRLVDFIREAGGSSRRQELLDVLDSDAKRLTRALAFGKESGLMTSRREGREAVYEVAS